jgi:hypothetical protein
MAKRPIIIYIVMILSGITLIASFLRLINPQRRIYAIEYFGPVLGQFDFTMDILLVLFSIVLLVGYFRRTHLAWIMTFYYYGLFMVAKVGALVISSINMENMIKYTSMTLYGEIRPFPFPPQMIINLSFFIIIIQAIVVYFILRAVQKNKDYFEN